MKNTQSLLVVFFLPLTCYLTAGDLTKSLETCCEKGKRTAKESVDCKNISIPPRILPADQMICSLTANLCCVHFLRETHCSAGMITAQQSGACTEGSGIPLDQVKCCESCSLGIKIAHKGELCERPDLEIGNLWTTAMLKCCHFSGPKPGTEEPGTNMCDMLPGELCAHVCIPTDSSYRCACNPGFVLMSDGKSCTASSSVSSSAENACEKCSHGCTEGICTCPSGLKLDEDSFTCIPVENESPECRPGFKHQENNTENCIDVDECQEGLSACDPKTERCVNHVGYYQCLPKQVNCQRGFQYSLLHDECEDVNECTETDDPPCDSNQECVNTVGSFICKCKSGFKHDPITLACVDINECQQNQHNCALFQRCDNTIGSYVCVRNINCGTGYTLNSESGKCEDDDECLLGTDKCRFQGPDWECKNTQGSFRCVKKTTTVSRTTHCFGSQCSQNVRACPGGRCIKTGFRCPHGFTEHGSECVDINECEDGTGRCGPNQRCVNIKGNYLCSDIPTCKQGFRLNEAKTQCIDINECDEQPDICSHTCENRWGSFKCRCRTGFTLHDDNRTCIDVNECDLGRLCQGYCVNQEGSYACQCPPGYRLGLNHRSCEDINECEGPDKVCRNQDEICINMAGSYRCNRIVCPPGYHKDGSRKTRCRRENLSCLDDDIECRRQPSSYTYNYITMVSNYTIPRVGYIKLFTVESSIVASPKFSLDLIEARVPPGVEASKREDFNLSQQQGKATIELLNSLFGPQEISLELKTEFYSNNIFLGTSIFNIEIYVSQYSF